VSTSRSTAVSDLRGEGVPCAGELGDEGEPAGIACVVALDGNNGPGERVQATSPTGPQRPALRGSLQPIRRYDKRLLSILTKDVLARIQSGDTTWDTMVPAVVASTIRAQRLFGVWT